MNLVEKKLYKNILLLGGLFAALLGIIFFAPGIFLGAIFAYIINSIKKILIYSGIKHSILIYFFIVFFFLCVVFFSFTVIPMVQFEVTELIRLAPEFLGNMLQYIAGEENLEKANQYNLIYKRLHESFIKGDFQNLVTVIKPFIMFSLSQFSFFSGKVMSFLYSASTFSISTIVFFSNKRGFYYLIFSLIPTNYRKVIEEIAKNFDQLFCLFLYNQFKASLMNSIFFFLLLTWVGMPFSFAISYLVFLGSFAPYFGCIIGSIFTIILGLIMVIDHYVWYMLSFCFVASYVMENYILVPGLVGGSINVHPLLIIGIMPLLLKVIGFFGTFLAVPLILLSKIMLEYFFHKYAVFHLKKAPSYEL